MKRIATNLFAETALINRNKKLKFIFQQQSAGIFFFQFLIGCFIALVFVSCGEYKQLGRNEKKWVLKHPVSALKIRKIKEKCDPIYFNIKKNPNLVAIGLDKFENGGKLDAFRHIFYSAAFATRVKKEKVIKLGIAHEKDNRLDFFENKKEETELADSISCEMDLLNNKVGVDLARTFKRMETLQLISELCLDHIKKGNVYFIKRDEKGNYLQCDGKLIKTEDYLGQWNIPKCLIQK